MQNMSFLKVKWGLSMRSTWRLQAFSRALFFHAVIRVHLGRYRVSNSIRKETTSLQPFWSQNNIHAVPPPRVRPRMYSSGQQGETLWCRGRSKAEGEVGKRQGKGLYLDFSVNPWYLFLPRVIQSITVHLYTKCERCATYWIGRIDRQGSTRCKRWWRFWRSPRSGAALCDHRAQDHQERQNSIFSNTSFMDLTAIPCC